MMYRNSLETSKFRSTAFVMTVVVVVFDYHVNSKHECLLGGLDRIRIQGYWAKTMALERNALCEEMCHVADFAGRNHDGRPRVLLMSCSCLDGGREEDYGR